MRNMLDLELVLLEELGFNLVLFSPYDTLAQLANDAGHPTLLSSAWGVVNDAHCTPLVLRHPPHVLAVGSLLTVCWCISCWWECVTHHDTEQCMIVCGVIVCVTQTSTFITTTITTTGCSVAEHRPATMAATTGH